MVIFIFCESPLQIAFTHQVIQSRVLDFFSRCTEFFLLKRNSLSNFCFILLGAGFVARDDHGRHATNKVYISVEVLLIQENIVIYNYEGLCKHHMIEIDANSIVNCINRGEILETLWIELHVCYVMHKKYY